MDKKLVMPKQQHWNTLLEVFSTVKDLELWELRMLTI